ncbi:hypothetical protein LSH36_673g01004 [Paralvinella palmiformis]|uniref:Uncharacterized protein n=1 Tax=Paralvinella palmiformis TaxID=53620 RepID=A0AAD9MTU1_9ANNE|nr:hypothetical protein LSH36_673g01004 [Paralvinella palmiformis]
MGLQNNDYKTLEIMLTGSNNRTLKGVLNFTAMDLGGYTGDDEVYDGTGAATFVIVVILVYGLSIVLMIGSLAKKNMKSTFSPYRSQHRSQRGSLYCSQDGSPYANQRRSPYRSQHGSPYRSQHRGPWRSQHGSPYRNLRASQKAAPRIRTPRTSMVAVGSPAVAGLAAQKNQNEKEEETSDNPSSHQMRSDSESLQALLEEDEESSDDARIASGSGPTSAQPRRQCLVSQIDHQPPRTRVLKANSSSPNFIQPEVDAHRSPSAATRAPPRVVVSNIQRGGNKYRPTNTTIRPSGGMLSPLEKDNKIIYKLDEGVSHERSKPCKLSMDSDGNIWILQASPKGERRSSDRLTPSPALPSPRSLGYESLLDSRTPSPNVFATLSPPALTSSGVSPMNSPRGSPRTRNDRSRSPRFSTDPRGNPSSSPQDRSRSPTTTAATASQLSSACCEHKHGLILTAAANLLPSGRKSPYYDPEDLGAKEQIRTSPIALRNDPVSNMAEPITAPPVGTPVRRSPVPIGSDEEELVQITTV